MRFLILFIGIMLFNNYIMAGNADKSLLIHYTFDENPVDVAKDLGFYGNDGKISNALYLKEFKGHKGILRFDGKTSEINCGLPPSLRFSGDLSLEMWVHGDVIEKFNGLLLNWGRALKLYCKNISAVEYRNGNDVIRTLLTDVGPILTNQWNHVAMVVEYPRINFYINGNLLQNVYMPFPGINQDKGDRVIGSKCSMYLDEIRIYRRALTAKEIAAHAQGKDIPPDEAVELTIEPNWYDKVIAMRTSCKGEKFRDATVALALQKGDYTNAASHERIALKESSKGSARFVSTAHIPFSGIKNRTLDATARIFDSKGNIIKTVYRHIFLKKPAWIHNKEGYSDKVLPPWTPIKTNIQSTGTVEVNVWGRKHVFASGLFLDQIITKGADILAAPIALQGQADGKELSWVKGSVKVINSTDIVTSLEQTSTSGPIKININTKLEYDGYMIINCQVEALNDTILESLFLNIPLRSNHATLCFGSNVYPEQKKPRKPLSVLHMGTINQDLSFRFSPNVWIGDEERGLTWQAESNEYWRYSNPQKAMQVLPRGAVTYLRANWINVPVKLRKGQSFYYKFALQATPVKPLLRNAWDLRVLRSDPYGGDFKSLDFNLAERWIDLSHAKKDYIYSKTIPELNLTEGGPGRMPALEYYAKSGMRNLYIRATDNWPWPTLLSKVHAQKLHKVVDTAHAYGLKVYAYMIHERMPTNVPEYDIYGLSMTNLPFKPYETCIGFCSKSQAFQDAAIYSLAQRLDEFGEDGIYLDGTGVHMKSCQNTEHGCGYKPRPGATSVHGTVAFDQTDRGSSGKDEEIYPTYPVFKEREFLKRLYTVVKKRRPNGIIDIHSWYFNSAGLAYADILWTGEQWWHLRGKGIKYISDELSLATFRTMFMGYQIGVAADVLPYRLLGSKQKNRQLCAISLLHDIPVRPRVQDTEYYDLMMKLFKMREQFGMKKAKKIFYWNNQDYIKVSPEKCYATLFEHPDNGVLAFISNLSRDAQNVNIRFKLAKLGLDNENLKVFNPLTQKAIKISSDGKVSVQLNSEDWIYIWLRKK